MHTMAPHSAGAVLRMGRDQIVLIVTMTVPGGEASEPVEEGVPGEVVVVAAAVGAGLGFGAVSRSRCMTGTINRRHKVTWVAFKTHSTRITPLTEVPLSTTVLTLVMNNPTVVTTKVRLNTVSSPFDFWAA